MVVSFDFVHSESGRNKQRNNVHSLWKLMKRKNTRSGWFVARGPLTLTLAAINSSIVQLFDSSMCVQCAMV